MQEKFHWTTPGGAEIVLPHMRNIPAGIVRKTRNTDEINVLFTVIEQECDEATLAVVDALPMGELEKLVEAWVAEVGPGESSSSSTS